MTKKARRQQAKHAKKLSVRLKVARENAGLLQRDVAAIIGIDSTAIARFENAIRNVTAVRLHRLAEIYEVPVEWFFETL